MMRCIILAVLTVIVSSMFATQAPGQVLLQVGGSGQVIGLTGLQIGPSTYNVQLVDGTCRTLFDGCNAQSQYAFNTYDGATTATFVLAEALASFDVPIANIGGCEEATTQCRILAPFFPVDARLGLVDGVDVEAASIGINAGQEQFIGILEPYGLPAPFGTAPVDFDTTGQSPINGWGITFARFSLAAPQSAVPEPSTWAMLLIGFASVGMALRRQPRAKASA